MRMKGYETDPFWSFMRNYEGCAEAVPEALGYLIDDLRRFIKVSAK